MGRDAATPGEDFKIAVAGPARDARRDPSLSRGRRRDRRLAPAAACDRARRRRSTITPVLLSLSWLLPMNVLILLFNLVPAFPLDGGRIARVDHLARHRRQVARDARRRADSARASRCSSPESVSGCCSRFGSFGGLWLIAMAYLLGQSATSGAGADGADSSGSTACGRRHHGLASRSRSRRDARRPGARRVLPCATDGTGSRSIDESGRFVGIARRERVQASADGGEGWLTIGRGAGVRRCLEPARRRGPADHRAARFGDRSGGSGR